MIQAPTSATELFLSVRRQSETLCSPLSPEDMMVQSCEEASPAKWHLAHTTWFFETFLLREFLPSYRAYDPDYLWLFNSYYNSISGQPEKKLRASFSRPSLASVLDYRHHVEMGMEMLLERGLPEEAERRLVLGLHHEQQHQELLAYDIKHAFWTNPLHPVYAAAGPALDEGIAGELEWVSYAGGLCEAGSTGTGFAFDNEMPRHQVYLEPFALGSRPVTCAEYLEFMEDGGYERPELWLSEGWDAVAGRGWKSPLYWNKDESGEWSVFTLRGVFPLMRLAATPVCHMSYFEADAFARWAGKRLPTEFEWEAAASEMAVEGNLLERGMLHPIARSNGGGLRQMFGDVWEWTASAYLGYPGYQSLPGALGEYNGKFMSNQMVLRGGSAVTPGSHIRATYRNFFSPAARWQFSGIRLASR